MIIIGNVLHDVLHPAAEDVAKLIDGVDLYILILTKAVDLRPIYIMMGIQIVLGDAPCFHGLP